MNSIFCSVKLYTLLGMRRHGGATASEDAFGNWNAHLFSVDRRKGLIFINQRTYYSLFITDVLKKDLAAFDKIFLHHLTQQFVYDKFIDQNSTHALINLFYPISIQPTNNDKATIGKMNDLIYTFKVHSEIKYGSLTATDMHRENNIINKGIVMSHKKYPGPFFIPFDEMKKQLKEHLAY